MPKLTFPGFLRFLQPDDPREAESRARERYFLMALAAAMFANVVFAGLRLAGELSQGLATGYWINVFGAVTLGLLALYYRADRQRRFRTTLHLGLAACAFCLVMPVRYGMVSSPWWLTIMPFAAALVVGARDGVAWAAISAVLIVGAHVWGPELRLPGTAGEDLAEAAATDWSKPLTKGNYTVPTCAYCHMRNGRHVVADKSIWGFGLREVNPNTAENKIKRQRWIEVCTDCHEEAMARAALAGMDRERTEAWRVLNRSERLLRELRSEKAFYPAAGERPPYPTDWAERWWPKERIGFFDGQASAFYNVSPIERD